MIHFRLIRDDLRPFIANVKRLGSSSGRRYVQKQMATRFLEITKGAIGESGQNRPKPWAPLSPAYAKRVHRTVATLKVSNALKDSIKLGRETDRLCEVEAGTPYAWAHMFGYPPNNLPARPYFPVEVLGQSYRPSYYADREMFLAASRAIDRITRHALPFGSATWTRSTFESHPIDAPVTPKD